MSAHPADPLESRGETIPIQAFRGSAERLADAKSSPHVFLVFQLRQDKL